MSREPLAPPPGLCDSCAHVRVIRSGRGSVFLMCLLSKTDPRFPKYPPLPVLCCAGYERAEDAAEERARRE